MKSPESENDDALHLAVPAQQETIYQAQRAPEIENPYASPAAPSKRGLRLSQQLGIVSVILPQIAWLCMFSWWDEVRTQPSLTTLSPLTTSLGILLLAAIVGSLLCGLISFVMGWRQENKGTMTLGILGMILTLSFPLFVFLES